MSSFKIIFVICAQAVLFGTISSQCYDRDAFIPGFGTFGFLIPGLASGCEASTIDITPTSGGNLPMISFSALPPTGLFLASENIYEGALAAAGELPFVGTVAVQGSLPTAGVGAVKYGCGNGNTDIYAETVPSAAAFSPASIAAPLAGIVPATVPAFVMPADSALRDCRCSHSY